MRVCLIGATHPCHNPRLVREADTLAERGHEVRVIGVRTVPALMADDERLMSTRKWRLERVAHLDALQIALDSDAVVVIGSDASHYTASKVFPYILSEKPGWAAFEAYTTRAKWA